ncbi:MAG: PKD domain-containing protein, partial [Bacteroidales bacterium]|nr:PKD domain-containing protein [Bacteroidales bacterium]
SFNPPNQDFCIDDAIFPLSGGNPTGGNYSGNGVVGGNFNPATAGIGNHSISYHYTNAKGCSNSESKDVIVNDSPIVSYTPPDQDFCIDEGLITLTGGNPTGGSYSGTGVSAGVFDPAIAGLGTHSINYHYTNSDGCSNNESKDFIVNDLPIVSYTPPNQDFCIDEGLITLTGGSPTGGSYSGTGVSAGVFDPAIAGLGTHSINYHYTNADGCSNNESKDFIVNDLPVVSYSPPDQDFCIDEGLITLIGGSPAGGVFSGTGVNAGKFNPVIAGIGTHNITYSYTNADGCSNNESQDLVVHDLPNVSLIDFPDLCVNEGLYTLIEGMPFGGTYSGTNVSAGKFDPSIGQGSYTIQYDYSDAFGCANLAQKDIIVLPLPIAPTTATVDLASWCQNQTPDSILLTVTGSELEYFWYENDFSGASFSHEKSFKIAAPTASVSYLVRGENNCGESSYLQIDILVNPSPVAAFNHSGNTCENFEVDFVDESSVATGTITNWNWNLDGTSTGLSDPSHTFTGYGTKNIQLIVETDQACLDTISNTIDIYPKPIAAFSSAMVCLGNESQLINESQGFGDIFTNYLWTTDGQSFTTENVGHIYSSHGYFDAELIITTEHACKDTLIQEVLVDSLPMANFSYTNPCKSDVVTLTNLSDGNGKNIDSYSWDFGNGSTSDLEELVYIYPAAGTYSINLHITDENGCQDEIITGNVRVYPNFDVQILAPDFCIGVADTLKGNATPNGITLDNWQWNIFDGSHENGQNIIQNFANSGIYTFQLIGNIDTCTAGDQVEIDVRELPIADFSYSGKCLKSPISFTDESSGDGLAITAWSWSFGDVSQSSVEAPTHTYNTTGTYAVELTATDAHGCENSTSQNLSFRNLPIADFNAVWPLCEEE